MFSVGQQILRQDPFLYMLHVFCRPDHEWRLVSLPCWTLLAVPGSATQYSRVDVPMPNRKLVGFLRKYFAFACLACCCSIRGAVAQYKHSKYLRNCPSDIWTPSYSRFPNRRFALWKLEDILGAWVSIDPGDVKSNHTLHLWKLATQSREHHASGSAMGANERPSILTKLQLPSKNWVSHTRKSTKTFYLPRLRN